MNGHLRPVGVGRTPLVRRLPRLAPPAPMNFDRRYRRGLRLSRARKWGYSMPAELVEAWSAYEERNARANAAYYARIGQFHLAGENLAA